MIGKVIRTAKTNKEYWAEKQPVTLSNDYDTYRKVIAVDSTQEFQTHIGFGGAFTEAAAYTLSEVSPDKREEVLNAYFDKENGLGYVLGRVHINSCDFALGNYTYIEEGDNELKTFDMSREDKWVVPLVKDATKVAGHELKILASPWSPPAFMKDTNEMNHGGKLLSKYYQTWANYFIKFIDGMKDRGINVWAVNLQNEPEALQVWDSCIYTAEEERDFIRDYLGPTLENSCHKDIKIIIWDHNRDVIVERATTVLADPLTNKYVWGIGNHWYISEEFNNLSTIHNMFPDKHILFTEGCVELTETSVDRDEKSGYMGAWGNGERYGRNIIGDFNNWSVGWIDWNLVLNELGGPNHVENYCEAPIMIDRVNNELIYNNSYYYIGHFSRHIRPGAKRISTNLNTEKIVATSFKNPNGSIVVVAQNEGLEMELSLVIDGIGVNITLPENSITTYIFQS